MVVHVCETLSGIICITRHVKAETTVNRKASTWSKRKKDGNKTKNKTWITLHGITSPLIIAV